jgi:cell division control protein 6
MVIRRLPQTSTLFRDACVFELDYLPSIINHRDAQLKELAIALSSVGSGYCPTHTLIRGPSGTGKTICIQKIFDEVEADTSTLIPVYVNAAIEQTPFNIYQTIVEKVNGNVIMSTNMTINRLFRMIGEGLKEKGAALCLCLDDADTLPLRTVLNRVLSDLLSMSKVSTAGRIGFFLVVSSMGFDLSRALSPNVSASLQQDEVRFDPYSRSAVCDILNDRVEKGVFPGVISNDVLEMVVEATEARKDIRLGIDLIQRLVNNAEDSGGEAVTIEALLAVLEDSRTMFLARLVQNLPSEGRRTIKVFAEVVMRCEGQVYHASDLYQSTKDALKCGRATFYRRLWSLHDAEILTLEKRTDGVTGYKVFFKFSPVQIVAVCEGDGL